jgi:hypothetical protein
MLRAGPYRRMRWVGKGDYVAHFRLVSRRTLDECAYKVFRHHFLLGADWRLCWQRKIDCKFFSCSLSNPAEIGRVFRDLKP